MYVEAPQRMKPIGILMIEHRLIERALDILESRLDSAKTSPDVIAFAEIIDFFGTYADETHHGKEEDIMFVQANQKSLSEKLQKLLSELKEEHVRFRAFRGSMAESNRKIAAGDKNAAAKLMTTAKQFIPLLRQHIEKEDKIFFPGFDELQDDKERHEMKKQFQTFDAERIHLTYKDVVERNKG